MRCHRFPTLISEVLVGEPAIPAHAWMTQVSRVWGRDGGRTTRGGAEERCVAVVASTHSYSIKLAGVIVDNAVCKALLLAGTHNAPYAASHASRPWKRRLRAGHHLNSGGVPELLACQLCTPPTKHLVPGVPEGFQVLQSAEEALVLELKAAILPPPVGVGTAARQPHSTVACPCTCCALIMHALCF